jgi:hypothetical protein
VITKNNVTQTPEVILELKKSVSEHVGHFATPDYLLIVAALPKTRSGKIMRRLLRKIATMDTASLGDTSTLAEVSIRIARYYEEMLTSHVHLNSNTLSVYSIPFHICTNMKH